MAVILLIIKCQKKRLMDQLITDLDQWFRGLPGTITAFSGGIDSTLVLFLSKKFIGDRAIGCISISPSLKRKDYTFAIEFCRRYDIRLEVVETRELKDANYFSNPSNRCYFCKNHLYETLGQVSKKYPGYHLLNGTNTDDLGDYRPGLEAAKEFKIRSPLVDCGINKNTVRRLARIFDLPNWDKPASPCLSSRVPYGNEITLEKLQQIELAEAILNQYNFTDVRVRHYGSEARIEVPSDMVPHLRDNFSAISASILKLGFEKCTIDEEGLVSGKLNRVLKP